MSDDIWQRNEPDSPCVKVCVMDRESGFCIGCNRTIDEISAWSGMSSDARRALMLTLPARAKPRQRRGGRAGRTT